MKLPIRHWLFVFVIVIGFIVLLTRTVLAQGSPSLGSSPPADQGQEPAAQTGEWVYDPGITELGKSAERARQLIFWVFSHPAVYNAPVLSQMWAFSRNIAYVFVVVSLVVLAVHLVLSQRSIGPTFSGISLGYDINLNIATIVGRIAGVLIFLTFSYVLVLGLIQGSSIMMRFFIEKVGGCDLFNIKFSAEGSKCVWPEDPNYKQLVLDMEKNYTEFKGYYFEMPDKSNLEMINSSVFLIRLTTFTYNSISTVILLRYVVLWFFLIVSPFLGILLPFIFIRNTGWIWIGEFFRWLFYGPLVALFIATIAKIWKAGIPFSFDFSRIDTQLGQVYPTSISILYGGPAQTLTQTNSANYVDTYAEYAIAIIMLWAAIILPWLLLRIFRDYCCDVLKENKAALMQIVTQLKQAPFGPSPSSSRPPKKDSSVDLPFRNITLPFIKTGSELQTHIVEQIVENKAHSIPTSTLARAFNLNIQTVADIARTEILTEQNNQTTTALRSLASPQILPNTEKVQQYETIKRELVSRAKNGDPKAEQILRASEAYSDPLLKTDVILKTAPEVLKEILTRTENHEKEKTQILSYKEISHDTEKIQLITEKTSVPEKEVREILTQIPTMLARTPDHISQVANHLSVSPAKVDEVLNKATALATKQPSVLHPSTAVSIEDYEEVKKMWNRHYTNADIPLSESIKSRESWIEEDIAKLTNLINLLTSYSTDDRQKGIKTVHELLPFLLLGGFSDMEMIAYLTAKLHAAQEVQEELKKKKEESIKELVSIPVIEKQEQKEKMLSRELPVDNDTQNLSNHWDEDETTSGQS